MTMPKNKMCWIIIADGVRARILANDGSGSGLHNSSNTDFISDNRKSRDIVSDRPGRSEGRSGGRHAMEPRVDSHQYEKQQFAKMMAKQINDACQRGDFDSLILVAPPQTLGELRNALEKPALSKVIGELGKDLTKVAIHDLPKHLEGTMRL
jgi:protein required for attachment to host cells